MNILEGPQSHTLSKLKGVLEKTCYFASVQNNLSQSKIRKTSFVLFIYKNNRSNMKSLIIQPSRLKSEYSYHALYACNLSAVIVHLNGQLISKLGVCIDE